MASSSERPSNECLTPMVDNDPDEVQPTKKARTLNFGEGEDWGSHQNACTMGWPSSPSQDFFPAVGEDPENYSTTAEGEGSESTQPTKKVKIAHARIEEDNQLAAGTSSDAADSTGKRRRYRKKTSPQSQQNNEQYNKHIVQEHNISVAYHLPHTPQAAPQRMQTTRANILPQNALITRGDLLSTSKYYQQHKALGHLPHNIIQISGANKNNVFLVRVA